MLPNENGFTFLEKIKQDEKFRSIPVVILSNFGQKEEIDKGRKLGAVEFLVKGNYSPAEIVEKIAEILKQSGTAQP